MITDNVKCETEVGEKVGVAKDVYDIGDLWRWHYALDLARKQA